MVLCIHTYCLSLDKQNLSAKIVKSNIKKNENILSEIHEQLKKYDLFHVNIEIQNPNEIYTGNCFEENN